MEHTHEGNHSENKNSFWYTYFGETGAAVVAFLYIAIVAFCIYGFLRWG